MGHTVAKQPHHKCLTPSLSKVKLHLGPTDVNLGMQLQLSQFYAFDNNLTGGLPSSWSKLSEVSNLCHVQLTTISNLLFGHT